MQALSEKVQELDKLRNEWASHTAELSSKHSQELTSEREKALQVWTSEGTGEMFCYCLVVVFIIKVMCAYFKVFGLHRV